VDADDVVAEVFARAAANVDVLQQTQRVDLYLLAAARNLCRDEHRRRRPILRSGESLDTAAGAADDPADEASEHEQRQRMLAAVEALPDALREVVVLRLSTELTFDEIAGITAAPLGTVLSRMHLAVRRLRRILGIEHESAVGQ
jgi:RNA polymerase sigma-70 factor (ECF subfamily)